MQWMHHNGPTAGSARVEVDNGAIENVLRVYERGAEKLHVSPSFNKTHMEGFVTMILLHWFLSI